MTSSVEITESQTPGCFELRVYHAHEGKMEALLTRFRHHTVALFAKHGMRNVADWLPVQNQSNRLIYLLSYPDFRAREASWKAFQTDPHWITVKAESEQSGPLVGKIESRLLEKTDFSPEFQIQAEGGPHLFEMRTYTATPGNLPRLLDRFRQHTLRLFSEHGMGQFGYFTFFPGQLGADASFLYFLVHASLKEQAVSWENFRKDPVWLKAKAESEAAAGGSLTVVPDGIVSENLLAADFSPIQ